MANEIAIIKQDRALERRREVAKLSSVMAALTPVERAVFLASVAKPVSRYDAGELAAELEQALKWIAKDVGYRPGNAGEWQYMTIRVAEIMKRYYSELSLKDFRMAFEMSVTGALDAFLPKGRDGQPDRGHYQQFNAEYVCKILNAYKAKRMDVFLNADAALPQEKEIPVDEATKAEYHDLTLRELCKAFEVYRETGILHASPIAEMLYYNILSEKGLAEPVEVTEVEQKYIWQRTVTMYAQKGYLGDVNRLKASGINDPELQHGAFALARRKALKAAFDGIITRGIKLPEYIGLV